MKATQLLMTCVLGFSLTAPVALRAADGPYKLLKEIPWAAPVRGITFPWTRSDAAFMSVMALKSW